jgi:hypothetical protein
MVALHCSCGQRHTLSAPGTSLADAIRPPQATRRAAEPAPLGRPQASVNKARVGAVTSRPLPHPSLVRVVARAPEDPIEVAICEPSSQAATAHS